MLYTDSFEISSPQSVQISAPALPAAPQKALEHSYTDALRNRLARPHLDLGLCLGSSTIAIASIKKVVFFPACVAVREKDKKIIAFGLEADKLEGREPEGVSVVRPIQNGVIVDKKLASYLLAKTLSVSKHGVISSLRAAVAVPPNLSPVESQTLLATVKAAGVADVYFVEQTLASAAAAFGDLCEPKGKLVIHIGAGVTHVSAICLANTLVSGSIRVAGDALDQAIIDYVRQKHSLVIDRHTATAVKQELGCALSPLSEKTIPISGQHASLGKPAQCQIGAGEVYGVISPLLEQIALKVRSVVAKMPSSILDDVRQQGGILSGGTAGLSRLDEFLSRETRLNIKVSDSPTKAAALGLQQFLKQFSLRQAVFSTEQGTIPTVDAIQGKGTGILGALLLSAALAFSLQAAPALSTSLSTSAETLLGASLIPNAPLLSGWEQPEAAKMVVADSFNKLQKNELQQENDRLRKLLKAPLLKAVYTPVAADVVARDPRGWMSSITINSGSLDGLKVGMPVTDGTNLVGQLVQVQQHKSQVRLFIDPKAVVAARVPKKRGSGVVIGTGKDSLEMRYLDPDSGVKAGDWVVTSGMDRLFPPGLKIGWVSRLSQQSGQNTVTATISPAMNVHQLETVLVLRKVKP